LVGESIVKIVLHVSLDGETLVNQWTIANFANVSPANVGIQIIDVQIKEIPLNWE